MILRDQLAGDARFPRKTNILSSLVWLSAITFPSGSVASALAPWPQGLFAFVVGSAPVFTAIVYYRYWTKHDPNRLQTEDFRIQLQAIAKIHSIDGKDLVIDARAPLEDNPLIEGGKDA